MFRRVINSTLNSKLFFNKKTLVNQLTFISDKKIEDGPHKDKIHYEIIANSYKNLNDALSFGLHRHWRRTAINQIPINKNSQILDAPGGTGLNTIRLLEKAKNLTTDSKFCVTVYDINPAMMKIGQINSKMMGYNQKFVRWIEGDIQKLPFEDESFDTYLLFFGIRQNIDFNLVFKEANRVLKSNGKIVIGELCYSKNPAISQWLYAKFVQYIGSKLFTLLTKDKDTYKFFLKNLINLPSRNQTIKMLADAGFKEIQFKPMSWKIAGMYVGYKM